MFKFRAILNRALAGLMFADFFGCCVGIGAGKYAEAEELSKSDEWFAQGRMVRLAHSFTLF